MAGVGKEPIKYMDPSWFAEALNLVEAEAEKAEEKKAREEEEKAREEEEKRRRGLAHRQVMKSVVEYDPKTKSEVYIRYPFDDFSVFDINEESPIPSMRYTERYMHRLRLQDSANILSVKIVSSDKGFPINVYGTIIARDSIDHKCIYLFNRQRELPTYQLKVEGTFEIKVLKEHFCGKIMVGIKGIKPMIVIYNSEEEGVVSCEDSTVITLRRRVMTLRLDGVLRFGFAVRGGGAGTRTREVEFTPQRRGEDKKEFSCGIAKLQVKVFWSMMDYRP